MENYVLERRPFFRDPVENRSIFHGVSLERNRLPIIAKRYDFPLIQQESQQKRLNRAINTAVVQAKVAHPNCCELLEVQIEIGSFDNFFMITDRSVTNNALFAPPGYSSPQLQETVHYAFKKDVYQLGAIALHLATLTSPLATITPENHDEAIGQAVANLGYSQQLRSLLMSMLAYEEEARPTMDYVQSIIAVVPLPILPMEPVPPREENPNISDINKLEGYELERTPFCTSSASVSLFKGISLARSRLPIIAKRHDFAPLGLKEVQQCLIQAINAAIVQSQAKHHNTCDIFEIQLGIIDNYCALFHIVEALETDTSKDVELRKASNRPYTETELRDFLFQTSNALTFAHSRVNITQEIAHRDLKPENIFRSGNVYKIGDFGCFFTKRESSYSVHQAGTMSYMSPQLREACIRGTPYNAFKSDVYALGVTLFKLAAFKPLEAVFSQGNMDQEVSREVENLSCSQQLKDILKSMLAYDEEIRPKMEKINQEITALVLHPQIEESKKPPVKVETLKRPVNPQQPPKWHLFAPKKK